MPAAPRKNPAGMPVYQAVEHHHQCPPGKPYATVAPDGTVVKCHATPGPAQDLALQMSFPDAPGGVMDVGAKARPGVQFVPAGWDEDGQDYVDVTAAGWEEAEHPRGKHGKFAHVAELAGKVSGLAVRQRVGHQGHDIDRTANKGYRVRLKTGEVQHYDTAEHAAKAAWEGKHHAPGKPAEPKAPAQKSFRTEQELARLAQGGDKTAQQELDKRRGIEPEVRERAQRLGLTKAPPGRTVPKDQTYEGMELRTLRERAKTEPGARDELARRFPGSTTRALTTDQAREQARPRPGAAHTRIMERTNANGSPSKTHLVNHTNDELYSSRDAERARLQSPTISGDAAGRASRAVDAFEREMNRRGLDPRNRPGAPPAPAKGPGGKKVAVRGLPLGYSAHDTGRTDYKGQRIIELHHATEGHVADLHYHDTMTPVSAPGSRTVSHHRHDTGYTYKLTNREVRQHAQNSVRQRKFGIPSDLTESRLLDPQGKAAAEAIKRHEELLGQARAPGAPKPADRAKLLTESTSSLDALKVGEGTYIGEGSKQVQVARRADGFHVTMPDGETRVYGNIGAAKAAINGGNHIRHSSVPASKPGAPKVPEPGRFEQARTEYGNAQQNLQRLLNMRQAPGPLAIPSRQREITRLDAELRNMGARRTPGGSWEIPPKPGTPEHAAERIRSEVASVEEQLREQGPPVSGYDAKSLVQTRADQVRRDLAAGEARITVKPPSGSEISMSDATARYLLTGKMPAGKGASPHSTEAILKSVNPGQRVSVGGITVERQRSPQDYKYHVTMPDGTTREYNYLSQVQRAVSRKAHNYQESQPTGRRPRAAGELVDLGGGIELPAWLVSAAAAPAFGGNAEKLREYWTHGEGGTLKVRWGTGGDFDRCVQHVAKFMANPQGYCAERHHDALGIWPSTHAKEVREGGGNITPKGAAAVLGQAAWNEAAHPRGPGGQFGTGTGAAAQGTPTNQNPVGNGETGDRVRQLQERLNELGAKPKLAVDGQFGPATDKAVRAYQQAHGLKVDGLVGPKTTGALRSKTQAPVKPKVSLSKTRKTSTSKPSTAKTTTAKPSTAGKTGTSKTGTGTAKTTTTKSTVVKTTPAIPASAAGKTPMSGGSHGAGVSAAQRKLNAAGAKLPVTGAFDAKTTAAVRAFQQSHKDAQGKPLKADGVIGPKTWAALTYATTRGTHGRQTKFTHAAAEPPPGALVPALVTIPGVDILAAGTWQLSTGRQTFTQGDLTSAIDAAACPAVGPPVIKIGHLDKRFTQVPGQDGEPAIGKVANLRMNDGGTKIVGDLAGMPGWLGAITASAYPRRSVEGKYGFKCQIGHTHPFVLTGLALLGITPPGVGVLSSLDDLAALYGVTTQPIPATPVAASWRTEPADQEEPVMPVTEEDVRRAYYANAGPPTSWWITELQMAPPQLIVADETDGRVYRVPYVIDGDDVTFGSADEIAEGYAGVAASRGHGPVIAYASAEDSRAVLAEEYEPDAGAELVDWAADAEGAEFDEGAAEGVEAAGVSDRPWADVKESDYTPEQWHAACIVHQHDPGDLASKDNCKLPIKEPSGVLNRNGVHAAAAALAGARTPLQAAPDAKAKAKAALRSAYSKLGESPPESLAASGGEGQEPGTREGPGSGVSGAGKAPASSEADVSGPGDSSEPGGVLTHPPFTGTHSHPHAANGDQGDDATHEHAHSHKGDAIHAHAHDTKAAAPAAASTQEGGDPEAMSGFEFTDQQMAAIRRRLGKGDGEPVSTEELYVALDTPRAPVAAAALSDGAETVEVPQITEGTYLVDGNILKEYQERAVAGDRAVRAMHVGERDTILAAAVAEGKFPGFRKAHFEQLWDKDPDGTRKLVGSLASGLVPTVPVGSNGEFAIDADMPGDFEGQQAYKDLYPEDFDQHGRRRAGR